MRRRSVLVPAISLRVASHVICRTSSSHRAHRPDVSRRRECERGLRYVERCKFQTSRVTFGHRVTWRMQQPGQPNRNVSHVIRRAASTTRMRCRCGRSRPIGFRRITNRRPCIAKHRRRSMPERCAHIACGASSTVAPAWGFSPSGCARRAAAPKRCVGETGRRRAFAQAVARSQPVSGTHAWIDRQRPVHPHTARRMRVAGRAHPAPQGQNSFVAARRR